MRALPLLRTILRRTFLSSVLPAILSGLLASLLAGAGLAGGCATHTPPRFVPTTGPRPALPAGTPVRVFLTGPPPPPYDELGLLEVNGTVADAVAEAQEEARRRGGNGIVLVSSRTAIQSSTTSRKVETRDPAGKVIQTQEVPVTETRSTDVALFAVISLP
jgi:hypothetical protein